MTMISKIRDMSVDELARFILSATDGNCGTCPAYSFCRRTGLISTSDLCTFKIKEYLLEEGSEEIETTIMQREPRQNAGYTIVETVRIGDSEFVAGKREDGSAVTWQYSDIGGYFWGHYFGSLEEALADLHKRVAEYCRMKADVVEHMLSEDHDDVQ